MVIMLNGGVMDQLLYLRMFCGPLQQLWPTKGQRGYHHSDIEPTLGENISDNGAYTMLTKTVAQIRHYHLVFQIKIVVFVICLSKINCILKVMP